MDTMTIDGRDGRLPDPDDATEGLYYEGVVAKRFFAWIVDSLIVAVLCAILIPFTAFTALLFLPLFWLAVGIAYRVITMTGTSATWGMRMAGVEFRRSDGGKFDLGTAVLHVGLYTIFVGIFLVQIVSVVLMLTTSKKQGLHDMILNTAAIRRSV